MESRLKAFSSPILIASSHMALPDLLRDKNGKKKKLIKGLMCKARVILQCSEGSMVLHSYV